MPTTRTRRPITSVTSARNAFATALRIEPVPFLNHLFQFTTVRLIVRGGGVSLYRRTQFGVFHPLELHAEGTRHDPVSGLALDPALILRICYLPCGDQAGTFELEFAGIGFSLALSPEKDPGNHEVIAALLSTCRGRPVPLDSIRGKGACDWLDEGFSSHGERWRNNIAFDRVSREIDIRIESSPLSIHCRMHPVLADRDDGIIRLSDAEAATVLRFDARTTNLSTRPLPFFQF